MGSKTAQGKTRNIFFPDEVEKAVIAETTKQGKTFSRIVREAVIPYLMLRGYAFTENANPSGQGVRSDLRKTRPRRGGGLIERKIFPLNLRFTSLQLAWLQASSQVQILPLHPRGNAVKFSVQATCDAVCTFPRFSKL